MPFALAGVTLLGRAGLASAALADWQPSRSVPGIGLEGNREPSYTGAFSSRSVSATLMIL